MTAAQILGGLILAVVLVSFIVNQGRELGYGFTLALLGGIVIAAAITGLALGGAA